MAISVHDAAILLGGSEQWVRSLCMRHYIGDAFSNKTDYAHAIAPKRMTYHIVPGQLAEFMRISEDELERRLEEVRNGKH